jgi:hypothetical protein
MFTPFPTNFSLLSTSLVLLIMAGASFFFAFLLHAKSRALRTLSYNISVQVFDKTFNVFDPNIKQRHIIDSHTGLIAFIAVYGVYVGLMFVVFKTAEIGGLLGAIAFVVCAFLLMLDETQELNKNAGIFTKAVNNHVGFGKGDLEVLYVMRKTLPRLSAYHLALGGLLFASALTVPFLVDSMLWASAGTANVLFSVIGATFKISPMYSMALMALVIGSALVTTQFAANKIRKRIFGFPPPIPIETSDLALQRELMALYCMSRHHPTLREPRPEDIQRFNRRELEEHPKE